MQFAKRVDQMSSAGLDALFGPSDGAISFAGGYPDAALFPKTALAQALTHRVSDKGLQYGGTEGAPALRAILAERMTTDGAPTEAADVLLTQGAQQGIDLVAKMMLDPGDGLVIEAPTYVGALSAFDAYEPTYYEVPMEPDGLDVVALKRVLLTHAVKLIYTIPDFQNPTGIQMSFAKRRALVQMAAQFDVLVLEDNPYRELQYDGPRLPTLRSLDNTGHVVSLGSFSKILAPGLRLGWAVADAAVMRRLVALKGGADVESSQLIATAVADYLIAEDFDVHLAELRAVYRRKRDAMVTALTATLPQEARITHPAGGFFVWLTMPTGFDMTAFAAETLLPCAGVAVVPGEGLAPSGQFKNAARLSFSGISLDEIETGAHALGQALQTAVRPAQGNAQ